MDWKLDHSVVLLFSFLRSIIFLQVGRKMSLKYLVGKVVISATYS